MELLVVVIIVGVLATIGISSFRARVAGSKSTEAIAMIQSIRAAQERWKAENLTYLNVTRTTNWYPFSGAPSGNIRHSFYNSDTCSGPPSTDDCRWKLLNPATIGAVQFGFMTNAGAPGEAMTEPDAKATPKVWSQWAPNGEYWYVIQAIADVNGDGTYAKFIASSMKGDVFRENEGD